MIRVVESAVVGKDQDPALCEDSIFVGPAFAAVVDGATDKSGETYGGVAGGRLASTVILEAIADLDPEVDARCAVNELTKALAGAVPGGVQDGPSAAIAMFSSARREVWQVGDVSFSTLGNRLRPPTRKRLDDVASGVRAATTYALLNGGTSLETLRARDPGRDAILSLLRNQYLLRNKEGPWTYGAIDGTRVPTRKLSVFPIQSDARELVIYSDGYPKAYRTLSEAEHDLMELLVQDPLCIGKLRGTKGWREGNRSFDDRAYLRLLI